MNKDKCEEFNCLRLHRVCKDHHIAIDGTLKQDNGRINNFSAFSGKVGVKGIKEISILYAFDTNFLSLSVPKSFRATVLTPPPTVPLSVTTKSRGALFWLTKASPSLRLKRRLPSTGIYTICHP